MKELKNGEQYSNYEEKELILKLQDMQLQSKPILTQEEYVHSLKEQHAKD